MKSSTNRTQLQRIYQAFRDKPKTMLMVAFETGIFRASICRRVADLRRRKKIALVRIGRCPITRHKAQFLTTDPELVEKIHDKYSAKA